MNFNIGDEVCVIPYDRPHTIIGVMPKNNTGSIYYQLDKEVSELYGKNFFSGKELCLCRNQRIIRRT